MRELNRDRRDQENREVERNPQVRHPCTGNWKQKLTQDREDDKKWPQKNKDGRQELEIRLGGDHVSFEVSGDEMLITAFTTAR